MKLNINWKIVTARATALAGAFAFGGTLQGAIPGKTGLVVTAVAGAINTFLPRAQKSAGILAALKQFRADSKAQKVEALIGATVERKVDALLKTQGFVRTEKGLVLIGAAGTEAAGQDTGSGIPNAAGAEGAEVAIPQDDKPAVATLEPAAP